ncbi:MAG: proton-conducting transporter membrane subunit, partial [Planctomycetales bacterium]
MSSAQLLSLIVFLPSAAALLLCFIPGLHPQGAKGLTITSIVAVFLLALGMLIPTGMLPNFLGDHAPMQQEFALSWIPSFDIYYYMGLDGISLPLVVLTAGVSLLAMVTSWTIDKNPKIYCILFLLLVTGMLGVFMSLDLFLFYVFWEVMLLPMYFLIGVWGGPRKEYAAIKFFLYTLFGSILMLVAILMLYFSSDLTDPRALVDANNNLLQKQA